jgi:hypothetical protein
MSMLHAHVNVHVHTYKNAGRRPASSQSGTGLKKTNDTGTGSVPD